MEKTDAVIPLSEVEEALSHFVGRHLLNEIMADLRARACSPN